MDQQFSNSSSNPPQDSPDGSFKPQALSGLFQWQGRWWIRWLPIVWVGLLCWIAFFHRLGDTGLLDETEPLFVEAARQMYVTGDWLTPYFNGAPRFDKPPLIYWLMAGCFRLFGVSEWSARLPVALSGSAIVASLFYVLSWLRRNGLPSNLSNHNWMNHWAVHLRYFVPYLGSAIVALNLQMVFFGRTGYSDMLLNACFTGSLLAFFLGYCQPETPIRQRFLYLLFFALMGLGILTKGPIGLVLPGAIVGIFLLLTRNLAQMRFELPWKFGPVLMLAIALPWYVLETWQNGWAFINAFFGFHNVQRFTAVVNQHGGPWYYHFLILLPGTLPWSIALPGALGTAIKRARRPKQQRTDQLGLLALIWFVGVMGFFSIAATKYITYSLPAVPALAILVTLFWNQQLWDLQLGDRSLDSHQPGKPQLKPQAAASWGLRLTIYATLASFAVLAIGAWYCPNWLTTDSAMPTLGMDMLDSGLPWIGTLLWVVGIGLGLLYLGSADFWRVKLVTVAAFILLFVTPSFGVVDQARQLPLRQMAELIGQFQQPNEAVAMGVRFFGKPSLVFYSQRPVALMNRSHQIRPYLNKLRSDRLLENSMTRSVLMVTTADALLEGQVQPQEYEILQRVGIYQLVRITLE